MAGTAAAVGHDGGSTFHHRFPIRVGHVGNEYVACFNGIHLGGIFHQAYFALADFLTDGTAFAQDNFFAVDGEAAQVAAAVFLGFHGLRTGLQDVEFAVQTVAAPFNVHWAAVVFFDGQRVMGQLGNFGVGNGEALTVFFRYIDVGDRFTGFGFVGKDHFDLFRTHGFTQDSRFACFQSRFEYIEFVRVDRALYDVFAQAVRRGNENNLVVTGLGIDGEHHTGRAAVGAHHALYACGKGDDVVFEAFVDTVRNGTVVVQGSEYMAHGFFNVFQAVDVQEGFLLTGKRSIRQVFCCCGRTYGNGNVRTAGIGNHFVPSCFDFSIQLLRERSIQNPLTDFFTHARQLGNVFNIQLFQGFGNTLAQTIVSQESAIGFGSGRKTTGNAYAFFSQLADHFAQRGIFTAHSLNVSHTQVFKPNNVVFGHLCVQSNPKMLKKKQIRLLIVAIRLMAVMCFIFFKITNSSVILCFSSV